VVDEEAGYKSRRGIEKRFFQRRPRCMSGPATNAIIPHRCIASIAAAIPEARRLEQ
jgi:hypothetical protein